MEASSTTQKTRPGGRSAKVRSAVHRAVEELLAEDETLHLTIPVIAARAGVHPTTVYRRWGSVGDLLTAVAASSFSGDLVVPDTGSLRGDLERWAADVATDLTDPEVISLMRATIGNGGVEGGSICVADRHTQLQAMIDRELERDQPVPAVEAAADALLGPLYYRVIFTKRPADPEWARGLVDSLLG